MTLRIVLAVLSAVVGIVWIGQGLGYIGGSFMTSDIRWTVVGVGMLVVAGALLWSTRTR